MTDDLIVATHGRAFWILDDITPLREATASLAAADAHLFTPAPAYRVQRDTYTDTPLPPDEPTAANPPDGAIIDYYLGHAASAPVTLEILDAHGQLVRKFSSADKPDVTEAELKKQLIPLYWLRPFRSLSADAGMHRWVWDLHYPAPDSTRHDYPISAIPGDTPRYPLGPTALPGSYTARLTANGKSYTANFTVKMDPRVKTSAAGLDRKFQLETRLAIAVEPDFKGRNASRIDSRAAAKTERASHRPNPRFRSGFPDKTRSGAWSAVRFLRAAFRRSHSLASERQGRGVIWPGLAGRCRTNRGAV